MQPSLELDTVARLAIASLCGLAVGIEREWSGKEPGTHARFAGVRTLFMLGGLAGVAGYLLATGMVAAGAVLLAGGIAIVVAAYAMASRIDGPGALDATTEVAALVVLTLGVIAGLGHLGLASGAAAIVVVALQEKTRLHGAIAQLDEHELRAAFHFAVLALVVLPVLPNDSYGPLGGIRPRELWMIVLIFSGLNFLGYLARKVVGQSRGDIVAGALGGLMSSTAVTWTFARRSRDDEASSTTLALGVVAACTVLLPRVVIISAVLNITVARALVPIIVVPFVVGLGVLGWSLFARPASPHAPVPVEDTSPLRFWSAMKMALAFQVSLMAINYASTMLGDRGVLASAAVLGLTDTDALTLSMNRLGEAPGMVSLAAKAIVIGVTANTVLKAGVMAALGSPRFRVVGVAGLAAMLIALVGALALA